MEKIAYPSIEGLGNEALNIAKKLAKRLWRLASLKSLIAPELIISRAEKLVESAQEELEGLPQPFKGLSQRLVRRYFLQCASEEIAERFIENTPLEQILKEILSCKIALEEKNQLPQSISPSLTKLLSFVLPEKKEDFLSLLYEILSDQKIVIKKKIMNIFLAF